MLTSREVFNRVKWDARFDRRQVTIGYRERGKPGATAMPFEDWDGTIPWHRIAWFALGGERIWDRETGLDRVSTGEALTLLADAATTSAFAAAPVFQWDRASWEPVRDGGDADVKTLGVVTWNVLSDRHDPEPARTDSRQARIFATLREREADVIALQEATPDFLHALLLQPWVRARYLTSDATGETLAAEGCLLLSRLPFTLASHAFPNGKRILLARFALATGPLLLGVLHATSNLARDARRKREEELETLARELGDEDALVVGDLNAREDGPALLLARGFVDAWRELVPEDPGFTFDPARNVLAAGARGSGLPARFDRALLRAPALEAVSIERFGNEREVSSDHDGLAVELAPVATITEDPVTSRAIAVLVPPGVGEAIDELRRVHDTAFGRWMPHVNLVFGCVSDLERARPLVERAVAGFTPFEVTLRRFEVFEHGESATIHLVPESAREGELERLRAAIARRFPACQGEKRAFVPHLTVGRFDSVARAREHARRFERSWEARTFVVRAVSLVARPGSEPFSVKHEVFLGGTLERWLARRGDVGDGPRREELARKVGRALGVADPDAEVNLTGGALLGLVDPGSDLDLVAATRLAPAEAARALEAVAASVEYAADARVPILRFSLEGVDVDLQLVEPGAGLPASVGATLALRELGEARAHGAFTTVLRALRAWTRARAIDAQAWGFPGGFTWASVAAWALEGAPRDTAPELLLARILERAASEPWPDAVRALARNLTPGTLTAVESELARAREIPARVLRGETTFEELVVRPAPPAEHALVARLRGPRALLEKRGVELLLDLEHTRGVRRVRPYAVRRSDVVMIGLDADDPESVARTLDRFAASTPGSLSVAIEPA